jgi:hypothetical protein
MKVPSGVRINLPENVVTGRGVPCAGTGASVVVNAGTATSVNVLATGSKICSVFWDENASVDSALHALRGRGQRLRVGHAIRRKVDRIERRGRTARGHIEECAVHRHRARQGRFAGGNFGDNLLAGIIVNDHLAGGVADQVELVPRFIEDDIGGRSALQLDDVTEGRADRLLRMQRPPRR